MKSHYYVIIIYCINRLRKERQMFINYMVMNSETAECDVFGNKNAAKKHIEDNCFIFPVDFVDDKSKAELLLYPNANSSASLPYVAEYAVEDLLNDDLRNADEDCLVKIALK